MTVRPPPAWLLIDLGLACASLVLGLTDRHPTRRAIAFFAAAGLAAFAILDAFGLH